MPRHRHPSASAGSGDKNRCILAEATFSLSGVTGVVRTSAWELAVESVEEALADGVVPSLERLGRLGQLGTLPSFVASLDGDEDPGACARREFAEETGTQRRR